jgi:hypothetical protein
MSVSMSVPVFMSCSCVILPCLVQWTTFRQWTALWALDMDRDTDINTDADTDMHRNTDKDNDIQIDMGISLACQVS